MYISGVHYLQYFAVTVVIPFWLVQAMIQTCMQKLIQENLGHCTSCPK